MRVWRNTYTRRSRGWCFQTECWASGGAGHKHNALTSAAECSGRRQTCSSPGRSWKQNHTANSFDCFFCCCCCCCLILIYWLNEWINKKNKNIFVILKVWHAQICKNVSVCKTFCLVYHFYRPNSREVLQIWTKSKEATYNPCKGPVVVDA